MMHQRRIFSLPGLTCHLPSLVSFFVPFLVVSLGAPAYAESLATLADPAAVTGSASTGVQFKPEYYEEPGQSAFVGLALRRKLSDVTSLGLSTKFTALRKPTGPNGDLMVLGNPSLRLSRQFMGLSGFAAVSPGLNRRSAETGLLATLMTGLSGDLPLSPQTDLNLGGSWIKPLYSKTLAESGAANVNHEFEASLGLTMRVHPGVELDASTGLGQQFFHDYSANSALHQIRPGGGAREGTFFNAVGVSIATGEKSTLGMSLTTSNAVLRPDGKRAAWILYRPDQSQAELILRRVL